MAHSQNPNHAKEDSLKVKDWYTKTYSDDELGEEINNDITFGSLWSHMSQGDNVYEILGVYDSVVRARVFEKLAEIRGVEYDFIYKQWLSSDKYANGGGVGEIPKYILSNAKKSALRDGYDYGIWFNKNTSEFSFSRLSMSNFYDKNIEPLVAKVITVRQNGVLNVRVEKMYSTGGGVGGEQITMVAEAIFSPNEKNGKIKISTKAPQSLGGLKYLIADLNSEYIASAIFEENQVNGKIETTFGEKTYGQLLAMISQAKANRLDFVKHAGGGGVGKKTFADLYQSLIKAVQKDIGVSKEKATEIVDENEEWLTNMIEYEGETNVSFLADQITTTDEGLYYSNGGGVGEYAESKFDSSVAKLREYIRKYPYIWTKNGKEYVPIEGWQFAGLILGYSTRVTEVTTTANGYMAKAEVVDGDGNVVCSGFGLVDKSESKWSGKPEYQLVGFAQTRAVSRALRNCLSWMVKAAGFNTTPAEEMYGVTPEKRGKMSGPRTFMPPMQSAKAEDTGFVFDRPEYQTVSPIEPVSAPMPKSENAEEIEETLRQMKAKAMANNIVIKSPDFMKEIDKALLGSDTDLQLSILKSSVMYMDENNIILQTPRYMSKLRKIANQEPF